MKVRASIEKWNLSTTMNIDIVYRPAGQRKPEINPPRVCPSQHPCSDTMYLTELCREREGTRSVGDNGGDFRSMLTLSSQCMGGSLHLGSEPLRSFPLPSPVPLLRCIPFFFCQENVKAGDVRRSGSKKRRAPEEARTNPSISRGRARGHVRGRSVHLG